MFNTPYSPTPQRWRATRAIVCGLLPVFLLYTQARAQEKDLVFHFDFANAQGKTELQDQTRRFKSLSQVGPFAVENKALRIAEGAKIMIAPEGLPPLSQELTISLWLAKGYFGDTAPLLFKGKHAQPIQFSFSVTGQLPQFNYKNEPGQQFWKGLFATGSNYGSSQRYANPQWKIEGEEAGVKAGEWTHLAVTFNRGSTKIYRNGRLVLQAQSETPQELLTNNEPIWIGSERLDREVSNYMTANALLNDLRLYSSALSGEEINKLYQAESGDYPKENLIPTGQVTLPPNSSYLRALHPNFDPDFERTLKQTARYEKQLPTTGAKIATTALAPRNGQIDLTINGQPQAPQMIYPLLARDNKLRLKEVFGVQRDFAAAGVELVNTGAIPPIFWTGDGQYDWAMFDSIFETTLQANPRAKIMANLYLRPPAWFFNKYPDEMERYLDTSGGSNIWYTSGPLASELWLQTSLKMLRDVVAHIEASPYADRIFGYMAAGGDAGEWYWAGSFTGGWPGYSVATEKRFQQWLAQRYADDKALQTAWGDAAVTLQTAKVPLPAARNASEYGTFRVRDKARSVFDYREFLNEVTYRNIAETCRTLKEATNRQKIVAIYYGYTLLYAGKGSTMQKGGLQTLGKVFENPDIDWIATPLDYVRRRGKEAGLNINAFNGSARLHGKMLWQENDLRTHFLTSPEFGRTADLPETLAVMERGLGHVLTNSGGLWWNTLVGNALFHEEKTMESVARFQTVAQEALQADRKPVAQVAFFLDDDSTSLTGVPKNDYLDRLNWDAYENAAKMGAPSDFYLLSDIQNANLPQYKLYVFLNAFHMDAAKRQAIETKVRANNAVAVWCYAPGFVTEGSFSTDAMQELTGITFDKEDVEKKITSVVADPQHAIMRYVKKLDDVTVAPSFYASDLMAHTLASGDGRPVIAVREFDTWRSVYSLLPLSKELLMGLCDYAGVPVYSRSFDVLNANQSYILLHTVTAGEKKITLPDKADVTEVLENKLIARGADGFSEKLEAGVTRVYRLTEK